MKCVNCGCTDNDCRGCMQRTGERCHWVAPRICSACIGDTLVALERVRQVEELGFTPSHDIASWSQRELRKAAECYARPPGQRSLGSSTTCDRSRLVPYRWPWVASWWKPGRGFRGRVRELAKAGALYLAEAARLAAIGRNPTALRMQSKAKACARLIDRILRQKAGIA